MCTQARHPKTCMRDVQLDTRLEFFWCFIVCPFYQCDIICVKLSLHCMYPKTVGYASMMPHGLSSIDNGLLEPLHTSILLWSMWHGCLLFNSILFHVCFLFIWKELSTLIELPAFQCGIELSLCPHSVSFECCKFFALLLQVEDYSKRQMII